MFLSGPPSRLWRINLSHRYLEFTGQYQSYLDGVWAQLSQGG
jgi:hypothetical protein